MAEKSSKDVINLPLDIDIIQMFTAVVRECWLLNCFKDRRLSCSSNTLARLSFWRFAIGQLHQGWSHVKPNERANIQASTG